MAECREKADAAMREGKPTNWKAAAVIVALWIATALLVVVVLARTLGH
jgi:hypothetical protein